VHAVSAAAASGAPYDVVVMDLYMARMNGDASLASLRAAGHGPRALPVHREHHARRRGALRRARVRGPAGQVIHAGGDAPRGGALARLRSDGRGGAGGS
jgi:hypothetical protein